MTQYFMISFVFQPRDIWIIRTILCDLYLYVQYPSWQWRIIDDYLDREVGELYLMWEVQKVWHAPVVEGAPGVSELAVLSSASVGSGVHDPLKYPQKWVYLMWKVHASFFHWLKDQVTMITKL